MVVGNNPPYWGYSFQINLPSPFDIRTILHPHLATELKHLQTDGVKEHNSFFSEESVLKRYSKGSNLLSFAPIISVRFLDGGMRV
jgi:hypothetical protein